MPEKRPVRVMRDRQIPLIRLYKQEPSGAWVTDRARTEYRLDDPLHSQVLIAPGDQATVPIGVHTAVGGDSDAPTPGDMLCAALASCVDSTLRVVADRMGIALQRLSVAVTAEADVRGTLQMSDEVPVAFQRMSVEVDLEIPTELPEQVKLMLWQAAERSCIVLSTLKKSLPISVRCAGVTDEETPPTASC